MKMIMNSADARFEFFKKSRHYESEDAFWFEDDSHLFRAAIESWNSSTPTHTHTHTHTAITSLAKGQLWQLDVTQLQLLSASATLAGREEGRIFGERLQRDKSPSGDEKSFFLLTPKRRL